MNKKFFNSALIVAAGNSTRMGKGYSKIFEPILDKPSIYYTLKTFEKNDLIDEIIIVCKENDKENLENILSENNIQKFKCFALGGSSRQESVFSGLKKINPYTDFVVIHDAARILVTDEIITNVIKDAHINQFSIPCVGVKDTIKIVNKDGFVENTPNRSNLYQVQTPQVFEKSIYEKAITLAFENGKDYTDDSQLLENAGYRVHIVLGSYENMKLTTVEDIPIFENILRERSALNANRTRV